MSWYVGHLLMLVKFKDGNQDKFPIWENIILIEASSTDEALLKGKEKGLADQSPSHNDFLWGNRPAYFVFAGIRKLIECTNPDQQPSDGTEISYSQFEVDSHKSLEKLIAGDEVMVYYKE